MRMISTKVLVVAISLVMAGCSTPSLFPPDVTKTSTALEFGALQAKPDVFTGRVVQLAGHIIGTETSDSGTLILARELPLRRHPAYGPAETTGTGAAEPAVATQAFAVLYPGKIDPNALWYGNKFVVIAVSKGQQDVDVNGILHKEPYMVAKCIHVWKTGGYYAIADFPNLFDGYYPLEQDTYCAP